MNLRPVHHYRDQYVKKLSRQRYGNNINWKRKASQIIAEADSFVMLSIWWGVTLLMANTWKINGWKGWHQIVALENQLFQLCSGDRLWNNWGHRWQRRLDHRVPRNLGVMYSKSTLFLILIPKNHFTALIDDREFFFSSKLHDLFNEIAKTQHCIITHILFLVYTQSCHSTSCHNPSYFLSATSRNRQTVLKESPRKGSAGWFFLEPQIDRHHCRHSIC